MGLWTPALYTAVNARLSGDTTLTALMGNGANSITAKYPFPGVDPVGTTLPAMTFAIVEEDNRAEPFDGRFVDETLEVHLYALEQPGTAQSLLTMEKIKERVMGDWPNQTAAAGPSYGLDRWKPDFTAQTGDAATAYTATAMVFDPPGFDGTEPGLGRREWIYRFKVGMFLHRS